MDFDKIKPTIEEIQLSEIQQQKIIEACKKQKRKSFNYKLWIPVAAAAMFAVVIFSPGFLFKASNADKAAAPENGKGFDYFADSYADEEMYVAVEDCIPNEIVSVQNQSSAVGVKSLFNSGVYRSIYSIIPSQFAWLVDSGDYEEWEYTVNASDGMAILQFVEHFGITKEEFDSANEAYEAFIDSSVGEALSRKPVTEAEEEREIFNADVIYSFDEEKINEYYIADYK